MPAIDQMIAEHLHHRGVIDRMWALTVAPHEALAPRRWRRLLGDEVRSLHRMLRAHFAREERDGYLIDAVRARPDLSGQAEMLVEQHATIRADLEVIGSATHAGADVRALQRRTRRILAVVRAHEHGEDELVHEALQRGVDTAGVVMWQRRTPPYQESASCGWK